MPEILKEIPQKEKEFIRAIQIAVLDFNAGEIGLAELLMLLNRIVRIYEMKITEK